MSPNLARDSSTEQLRFLRLKACGVMGGKGRGRSAEGRVPGAGCVACAAEGRCAARPGWDARPSCRRRPAACQPAAPPAHTSEAAVKMATSRAPASSAFSKPCGWWQGGHRGESTAAHARGAPCASSTLTKPCGRGQAGRAPLFVPSPAATCKGTPTPGGAACAAFPGPTCTPSCWGRAPGSARPAASGCAPAPRPRPPAAAPCGAASRGGAASRQSSRPIAPAAACQAASRLQQPRPGCQPAKALRTPHPPNHHLLLLLLQPKKEKEKGRETQQPPLATWGTQTRWPPPRAALPRSVGR